MQQHCWGGPICFHFSTLSLCFHLCDLGQSTVLDCLGLRGFLGFWALTFKTGTIPGQLRQVGPFTPYFSLEGGPSASLRLSSPAFLLSSPSSPLSSLPLGASNKSILPVSLGRWGVHLAGHPGSQAPFCPEVPLTDLASSRAFLVHWFVLRNCKLSKKKKKKINLSELTVTGKAHLLPKNDIINSKVKQNKSGKESHRLFLSSDI